MHLAKQPATMQEEVLTRIMNAYGDSLLRMAYLYLGDAALAEDAVQETFIRAYKSWSSFRGESSEKTYLTRITINVCKDLLRSSWMRRIDRRRSLEQLPERGGEFEVEDPTVFKEISRLSPKYKEVILLFYYQELKLSEISALLKIPEATVSTRLLRARKKLYQSLEGWYFDEA